MTGAVLTTSVTSRFICAASANVSRAADSFVIIVIIYSRGRQTREVYWLVSAPRQDRPNDHSGLWASSRASADPGRKDTSPDAYEAPYNRRVYRNRVSLQGLVPAARRRTRPRIEIYPPR